ncbi:MAG: ATP-dependent helicase [Clostridia bacterium]|nr:ATP-dependent helicase [Clostridia bacterium]
MLKSTSTERNEKVEFFNRLKDQYEIALDQDQERAAAHVEGPAVILAGPGSGKTTVITARTAFLVLEKGIDPSGILTLTFNRAARYEMENRFNRIFGETVKQKINFSTMHSFCNWVVMDYERKRGKRLKRIEGDIETEDNKRKIIWRIYQEINGTGLNDDQLEDVINEIGFVKNKMIKDFQNMSFNTKNFSALYKAYEDYKRSKLYMDFDDMLSFAYGILVKCPDILNYYKSKYRFFQVDEGQDLSKIQFEILKLLVKSEKSNLFLVADDDQSVYGFRGAEPRYIFDLEKEFPECKLFRLENNYRSSRNIVEISSRFIKGNIQRYDKVHRTENGVGVDPVILRVNDEEKQLKFLKEEVHKFLREGKKVAVLYRNNLSSLSIVDAFDRKGIPYKVKQNKLFFFNHWVVQDILAFFKFSLDPYDKNSFLRIYYKMNRYISKSMLECALESENEDAVIDGILKSDEIKPYQQKILIELKGEFKRLARSHPSFVLQYIEEQFKYFSNVSDYCENTGLSFEYLYSFFGIIKTIAAGCQTVPQFLQRMEVLQELVDKPGKVQSENPVTLTTLHSSKGLEYDCVFMVDLTEGEIPGNRTSEMVKKEQDSSIEEERRIFYVGMTRAKEYLYLISPETKNEIPESRSPFVDEVIQCIHERVLDELGEGLIVNHKYYGKGVIENVNRRNKGVVVLEIDFDGIRRKVDFFTCMESGVLKYS